MVEVLYTGRITAAELQEVVTHCHFTQEALFLAEQLPTHLITNQQERQDLLRFTYLKDSSPCGEYTSGRIFQENRELRWEKQGESMRVVYLGPTTNAAELEKYRLSPSKGIEVDSLKKQTKYYYLFGERLREGDLKKLGKVAQPGDFAVLRIPRILRYPMPQNNHRYVRLVVCEYLDEAGHITLFRFQRLEPMGENV